MPLFHFVIDDGTGWPSPDPVTLDSAHAARVQAVRTAALVLDDKRDGVFDGKPTVVTVEDDYGTRVCTVTIMAEEKASNVHHLPVRLR